MLVSYISTAQGQQQLISILFFYYDRGYPLNKIQENNEAEIMQSVLDEARESYAPEIVVELTSESPEDIESNLERVKLWIQNWRSDQGHAAQGE